MCFMSDLSHNKSRNICTLDPNSANPTTKWMFCSNNMLMYVFLGLGSSPLYGEPGHSDLFRRSYHPKRPSKHPCSWDGRGRHWAALAGGWFAPKEGFRAPSRAPSEHTSTNKPNPSDDESPLQLASRLMEWGELSISPMRATPKGQGAPQTQPAPMSLPPRRPFAAPQ